MGKLKNFKLWWVFFLYTFCISAFVQIVLLPYVFPSLYAGNGLLNCSFDSIGFHKLAVDLANKISIQGWSAWQLKPEGQAPAGIASIVYFFILPDPRILIPLNAALHASAALILVNLLNLFIRNKTMAILCVLPFLIFPSNLQWTAQWHKDSFSILGVVLVLQSIVLLYRPESYKVKNWFFINFCSIISSICGLFLIWLARAYMLTIIGPFVALVLFLLLLTSLIRAFKKEISLQKTLFVLVFMPLVLFIFMNAEKFTYSAGFRDSASVLTDEGNTVVTAQPETKKIKSEAKGLINKDNIEKYWKRSSWLPLSIESKAYYLSQIRKGFRSTAPEARSNIDHDIGFGSIKDILAYLPRAAQIAFFAPFPNQWLSNGSYLASSLMHRVAAYEMIVVYFALLFLPYAIWHWHKRIEIWIISAFCIYMMLTYGLVVCNIGSLYRLRYVYITTLAAVGIAGFIAFFEDIKIKRDKRGK